MPANVEVSVNITRDNSGNYSATYGKLAGPGTVTVESDGTVNLSNANQEINLSWILTDPYEQHSYEFQGTDPVTFNPIVESVFSQPVLSSTNVVQVEDENSPMQWEYTLNCIDVTDGVDFQLDPKVINR